MVGRHRKDPRVERIREMTLFRSCNEGELVRLARLFDEARAEAGKLLIQEGRPGAGFYVIEGGLATVSLAQRSIATLGPGDFFGEMSLLERAPTTATIVAKTDMALLVMDKRSFGLLLQEAPSLAQKMLEVISRRLRAAERAPTGFATGH